MRICIRGIYLFFGWCGMCGVSAALDYAPSWDFSQPIGDPSSTLLRGGFLLYTTATGELTYRTSGIGDWLPPDVGSKSGLLAMSAPLQPVPLGGIPTFRFDESFEGSVVAGSNAIRINFDGYAFWPWWPDSPEVLQSHGLSRLPTSYEYGAVLPAGLTKEILEVDIYGVSFPNGAFELRVVPEPTALVLLGTAALFASIFRSPARDRKNVTA
jgi:hypothetical protein